MRDAIKRSIDRYATEGVPTGGFLRAVLEHRDVFEVFAVADEDNMRDMREILTYIHCELPGNCHGSRAIVEAWIDKHRPKPTDAEVIARCEDMLTGPANAKET